MDVFIKSFNRPYYLERCLRSIAMHVTGVNRIIVLDDGTPSHYLEKIKALFPLVTIHQSEGSKKKQDAIQQHLSGNLPYALKNIPARFWWDNIAKASDFFFLLEEDAWITQPIDLVEIEKVMQRDSLVTTKLFWCGNENLIRGKKRKINQDIEEIIPQLPFRNPIIGSLLLRDKFKVKTLLTKLGILRHGWMAPFYSLYTVSSSVYQKAYWLTIFTGASEKIDEGDQLFHALKWHRHHRDTRFAKSSVQRVNTSYITSAANAFKSISFDFIRFNYRMNEAWFESRLESMQDFPQDFSPSYLSQFLDGNDVHCNRDLWVKWIAVFKGQFIKSGCVID
jgi:hypothetical protein